MCMDVYHFYTPYPIAYPFPYPSYLHKAKVANVSVIFSGINIE